MPRETGRRPTERMRRAMERAAKASMLAWCQEHYAEYFDDVGEVDATALGLACAAAHGEEYPTEFHPAWDAAAEVATAYEVDRHGLERRKR